MGKFDEKMEMFESELKSKAGVKKVDGALLKAAAKACGPSIYLKDASMVSCSDPAETGRVRDNFCTKNLGVSGAKADTAIAAVCKKYDSKRRQRAVFYYLLAVELKKESKLK